MEYINTRIKTEICYNTLSELTDEKLMSQYIKSPAVKKNIKKLESILDKYIDEEAKNQIIKEYFIALIPPGTKGAIRGNKFNKIVKSFITNLKLDDRFEVSFEKKCISI